MSERIVFDLHYIRGPREVVGLTKFGQDFLRLNIVDRNFYNKATQAGLHVSFEDANLQDRILAESNLIIQWELANPQADPEAAA